MTATDPGRRQFLELTGLALAGWGFSTRSVSAQVTGRVPAATALMLRLSYRVRDVDATARFWTALGATSQNAGGVRLMSLGGLQVELTPGTASASSDGSVVNHIAFRVPTFDAVEQALTTAGMRSERSAQFPGTLNAFTPEGDKVEIFNNISTSPGFKPSGTTSDDSWQRHNGPVQSIVAHHLHFYVPAGQEQAAQQWYLERFGGTAGIRLRYAAVDYPGINLNFSTSTPPSATAPTAGRSLDHIGFVVRGLDDVCKHIAAVGTKFETPLGKGEDGVTRARLVDPWGTSIELTAAR